jgi:phage-related holin
VLWYIFTELGSIIENAAQLGAPIPRWLRSIIASAKKTADSALPAEEEKPPSENEERKT